MIEVEQNREVDELTIPWIYTAILGVMNDIGAIEKKQRNLQQKYMFRGIDQVYNALQPAMVRNGVFAVPIVEKEERTERTKDNGTVIFYSRLHVTYRFYAADGSYIEARVIGEAMDSGDKATNKAMSAAYKYACFQVFCIPTEEMPDADRETHDDIQPQHDPQPTDPGYDPSNDLIDKVKRDTLVEVMNKKGVKEKSILDRYGINSLEEMTMGIWYRAMKGLEKTADAAPAPEEATPDLGI